MSNKRITTFILMMSFLLLLRSPPAQATMLTLSDVSSNGTPYEWLDAQLDFSVIGDTLTLTVNNTTGVDPGDEEYDISEIFLNFGGNVEGLQWLGGAPVGWTLDINPDNIHVDSFGYFDVGIMDGYSSPRKAITPGKSETFEFTVSATGPFSVDDFTTYMSLANGGDTLGLAAAKFDQGGPTGDDWAYGMVIPEPATIGLLGLGGLLLLRRSRRA